MITKLIHNCLFVLIDVYIEAQDTNCDSTIMLAEPKATLNMAKYLCSVDPTCTHFFMEIGGYRKGTYYKCAPEANIDPLYDNFILFTKGK